MVEQRILNTLDVPWSAALVLIAAGLALIVLGSRWRDFTEVFSASVLGGAAAMLLAPPLPLNPIWPIVGACLLAGLATLLFRRVATVILAGLVSGLSLSVAVHVLADRASVPYYVWSLSTDHVLTVVLGPDYVGSPLLLGLLLGGIVSGATLALAAEVWARRVVMGLEGGLALLAGAILLGGEFFSARLPSGYPMQYLKAVVVAWLGLAVLAVVVQHLAEKPAAARRESDAPKEAS
ncbi:MAG TPA: hypothetical protein PLP01_14260 [Phycisphaerae bacterium]|nr:hypothetical protein [Phycisphaerae bacterium]HOI56407.1 hypothetical protein [Phycisphaerae bacterium]